MASPILLNSVWPYTRPFKLETELFLIIFQH